MKKLLLIIVLGVGLQSFLFGQSCLPNGIIFTTQTEIDNFQTDYPGCTEIEGDVEIRGHNITNLNGLLGIKKIYGFCHIHINDCLINLMGLDSLEWIGVGLEIDQTNSLTNFAGLEKLETILGYLKIYDNTSISILSGLDNLIYIGGFFFLGGTGITSLMELNSLEYIGGRFFLGNTGITDFIGLNNLEYIGENFIISGNDSLVNFMGLDSLSTINGLLHIGPTKGSPPNLLLTSLAGLNNVNSIAGSIKILSTPLLTNLDGLSGLDSIGGNIYIKGNNTLSNLYGLENISANSIQDITIHDNSSLSICHVQSICDYLASPNGTVEIYNNATGCNSQPEVETACLNSSEQNIVKENCFSIYPNPITEKAIINLDGVFYEKFQIEVFNINGIKVITRNFSLQKSNQQELVLGMDGFPAGMYFIKLNADQKVFTQKIMKIK